MKKVVFQTKPIDITEGSTQTGQDKDGSVLIFVGRPRVDSNGKSITHLEYDIYEDMASSEMNKIVDEAMERWSVTDCLVVHRYGRVEISEASILICVSSPHRDEGYQASRFIIDTIKKTVPIWKKECYTDGSEWISDRA